MVIAKGASSDKIGTSTFTFHRHGSHYFLKSVTDGTTGLVMSLPQSRRAKEVATTSKPEIIVAAAQ